MVSKDGAIEYKGKKLRDEEGLIKTDKPVGDGYPVR